MLVTEINNRIFLVSNEIKKFNMVYKKGREFTSNFKLHSSSIFKNKQYNCNAN